MGNCCKSSNAYSVVNGKLCGKESRSLLASAPAPEAAPAESGGYDTAGLIKEPSKEKKNGRGFPDWGDGSRLSFAGASADEGSLKWINFVVDEIWPFADEAIHKFILEQVEPQLKQQLPKALQGLHFNKCELGSNVPKLGPVHVHQSGGLHNGGHHKHSGVEIDVGFQWDCKAEIEVQVMPGVNIGIKRLGMSGTVCVVLRPLMKTMPIVGGVQLFMLSPPQIDWDFTGAGNFADFPVVSTTLRQVVRQLICDQMVLPNRVFVHWLDGRENEVDITGLQFPKPEGILRLCVVGARGLDAKDWHLLGKSTSDPYATVHIGDSDFRTSTKLKTCDPQWNDEGWADFAIYSRFQNVAIELFDSDWMPKGDDFLGRVEDLSIRDIVHAGTAWYSVTSRSTDESDECGHPAGEVQLAVQAFEFKPDAELLQRPPDHKGTADTEALLQVKLRSLRGLPAEKAGGVVMVIRVGGQTFRSQGANYVEAKQNFLFDLNTVAIDPAAQRMAEFLSSGKDKLPIDRIAEISGLHEESLEKVLREKPSFTTRWNQGFNILLKDVLSAEVHLELHHATSLLSVDTKPMAVLASPFQLKDLLEPAGLTWDGLLCLKPPASNSITKNIPRSSAVAQAADAVAHAANAMGDFAHGTHADVEAPNSYTQQGHLDLDIQFSLFGLELV